MATYEYKVYFKARGDEDVSSYNFCLEKKLTEKKVLKHLRKTTPKELNVLDVVYLGEGLDDKAIVH